MCSRARPSRSSTSDEASSTIGKCPPGISIASTGDRDAMKRFQEGSEISSSLACMRTEGTAGWPFGRIVPRRWRGRTQAARNGTPRLHSRKRATLGSTPRTWAPTRLTRPQSRDQRRVIGQPLFAPARLGGEREVDQTLEVACSSSPTTPACSPATQAVEIWESRRRPPRGWRRSAKSSAPSELPRRI
jgi:hypothetical protein